MDRQMAAKLIEENLNTIFAWSLSKVYDKSQAEDLAQDVICEVLKSVHRLEKDEAFFGFMWRIAENTLCAKLRKKQNETVELDENFRGVYWITPEDEVIKSEEIKLLRRELSLLSKNYREVTVRYYIYGKSCSEIASEMNISVEMVKYYLFKTRKIMKEGIGMTREYGEKSYNPQMFRVDFWGGNSYPYFELFKRKLPGNIVLSAYYKPVTITELSMELGVSAVYLEDEIAILEKHELVKKIGDKYQTNIIIFTDDYQKRVLERFKPIYEATAESINEQLDKLMPELKKYDIGVADDNSIKWAYTNFILYHAWMKADKFGNEKYGTYPQLSNGSHGFVYGFDNDYENHHFNGIYGHLENKDKNAWVTVLNYMAIEKCQHWKPYNWERSFTAMVDAVAGKNADEASEDNEEIIRFIEEGFILVNNGKLIPNFPVITTDSYETTKEKMENIINEAYEYILKICDVAEEVLSDYVPGYLKDKCGRMAQIQHQMDGMAYVVETMVEKGQLIVPKEKANIGIFGVIE